MADPLASPETSIQARELSAKLPPQHDPSPSPLDPPTVAPAAVKPAQSPHSKPCSLCHRPRDVLVRCQIDETKEWHFVCVGKCWQQVSGGQADGDNSHPLYRYGGMWKNKHEGVSAKIKGKAKKANKERCKETSGSHRNGGSRSEEEKKMKMDLGGVAVGDDGRE